MKRLLVVLVLACDPPVPAETPTPATSQTIAQPPAPQNIDVRVEFEETNDTYGATITAFLTVSAMGVHTQLFSVPFPYQCLRGESDAGDALVVECRGDDGSASVSVRLENGHVIAVAHDYGRITADETVKDLALPAGGNATIYAPPKMPGAH